MGNLRHDADLSSARGNRLIADQTARLGPVTNINVFEGEFSVDGDFVAGLGSRRGPRRTSRILVDAAQMADVDNYVRPVGFTEGVDMLDRNNVLLLSGAARTGRRSRALATVVAVLQAKGLPLEVSELRGNVLGNMAWRVPNGPGGFLVVDRAVRGKHTADAVDDRWLNYAADQLRERGNFLVVVTGPVQGSLSTAPSRAVFVLEDLELPDPLEIVRKRVAAELPWAAEEFDALLDDTELADILDERDDPRFATRAARRVIEALRGGTDLREAIAKLRNADEQVGEWLGTDPDNVEIGLVLATAALEGSTYLNISDAAVELYRALGNATATITPRYVRTLTAERGWIEWVAPDDGPPVLRFRHAALRQAVLLRTWFELDGARAKVLEWLTKLADHPDVEVRARAAGAAGVLATSDFEHALYQYFLPWASAKSPTLRQSAGLGLNVAGTVGGDTEAIWRHVEYWAEQRGTTARARNLAITAALAACGPIGVAEPHRALRVLRVLLHEADWWALAGASIGAHMLLEEGRVSPVLDALLEWSEAPSTDEPAVKALAVFTFAAGEPALVGAPDGRPVLLDAAADHRDVLPELWGRALASEVVRPLATEALRTWVETADRHPSSRPVVLDLLGGIADRGRRDYERVLHLLRGWGQAADDPSDAAADFYDDLVEVGGVPA
ncbi:MAG: hypothetical protein HOY78_28345 [Saccharothrix sp.]|nr:hypothetical protein [Saccharothrix sp.]